MKRKDACIGEGDSFCNKHPETCNDPYCTQHK